MAWSEKLLEALRKGMVLNERLNGLADKIERALREKLLPSRLQVQEADAADEDDSPVTQAG